MEELGNILSAFDAATKIREIRAAHRLELRSLLLELTAVVDALDRLCPAGAESVALVRQQLDEVLRRQGVEEMRCVGGPFDPNLHEAVRLRTVEDVAAGTILEQLTRGYRWGEELLRPPRVVVADAVDGLPENSITEHG